MFRLATLIALACTLAIPFVAARAQEGSTSQPSTQPGEVIDVKDFAKLKEMIGTEVTIRGKVTEVFVPRSASVSILNFDGIGRRDFNVVIPKGSLDAINAAFDGDVTKAVTNQTISVTGKVADYRGNPQIQLEKPESLKIEKSEEEKKE
ncbi:MAG: hypothetical protein WBD40_15335 [Tepidisphaeraceae bacterium]